MCFPWNFSYSKVKARVEILQDATLALLTFVHSLIFDFTQDYIYIYTYRNPCSISMKKGIRKLKLKCIVVTRFIAHLSSLTENCFCFPWSILVYIYDWYVLDRHWGQQDNGPHEYVRQNNDHIQLEKVNQEEKNTRIPNMIPGKIYLNKIIASKQPILKWFSNPPISLTSHGSVNFHWRVD